MNILELGINAETFDSKKLSILNDYIKAFDTLSKYDGKVYNPVMGNGLIEFNTSILETNKLLDELNLKYSTLGKVQNITPIIKAQVDLKSSLSETTKEILNQNTAQKTAIQLRIEAMAGIQDETGFQKENTAMRMQAVGALKALAVEQDRASKTKGIADTKAQKQADQELREEELQRVAALKAQNVLEQEATQEKLKNAKATLALASDYEILKKALKDQATNYSNSYINTGKDSAQTKAALAQYTETASIITNIDKNLNKATGSSKLFGGALSSAFGQLRTLAYILPGIGIAGLFNVAFDAIGKVVEATGLFNDKLTEQLKLENQVNTSLSEQFDIYKSINDQRDKLYQQTSNTSSTQFSNEYNASASRGLDQTILNQKKIDQLVTERDEAFKKLSGTDLTKSSDISPEIKKMLSLDIGKLNESEINNTVKATTSSIDLLINSQKTIEDKISDLDKVINTKDERDFGSKLEHILNAGLLGQGEKVVDGQLYKGGKNMGEGVDEEFKKRAENQKTILQLQQKTNNSALTDLISFNTKQQAIRDNELSNIKFNEDQKRKLETETSKENISVNVERNRIVLSNQTSTERQIFSSLRNIRDYSKQLNKIDYNNIADNISSTPADKEIAANKLLVENKKADLKYNEDIEKQQVNFYQRRLKATTETAKNELEIQAISNEKIETDLNKSLEERVKSYDNYISLRQKQNDLETKISLRQGASSDTGKTSLIREEQNRILSYSNRTKVDLQADTEKKIYDIVYSSLQKQLKSVIENNKLAETANKDSYIKQLTDLNKALDDRKIKYAAYRKFRNQIDNKNNENYFDAKITDDKSSISSLEKLLSQSSIGLTLAKTATSNAKSKVDSNTSNGINNIDDNRSYDTAVGKEKAYADEITQIELKLKDAGQELRDDELKKQESHLKAMEDAYREHAANRKAIEEGVYNLIKTFIDANTEYQIEKLEKNQQIVDEQYGYEIDAVSKSSLSSKDKNALDVQLNEQKKESDKNAYNEERKLKHDAAVADRDLTLAHIAWETEQSIMSAYATPFIDPVTATGLAIERGILGAISAATVLATPIPSFAEGVENFKGGYARFAEAGPEWVKEPYKSPYLAMTETISWLPKGTDIIPTMPSPVFSEPSNSGWEQTKWLACELRKNNKQVKNQINNVVNINLGYEIYKKQILGN